MKGFLTGTALVFSLAAAALGVYAVRLPWVPSASFDVLGVQTLFANLPKMAGLLVAVGLAVIAVLCLVWARRLEAAGLGGASDSEGWRLAEYLAERKEKEGGDGNAPRDGPRG